MQTRAGNPSILVVDDHSDTLRAMGRIFGSLGYAVTTANSLASARLALAERAFDILICDLQLSDGDGCELLTAEMRQREMCSIVLTGHVYPADRQRCAEAGFHFFIAKPTDIATLLKTVSACLPPPSSRTAPAPAESPQPAIQGEPKRSHVKLAN